MSASTFYFSNSTSTTSTDSTITSASYGNNQSILTMVARTGSDPASLP